MFDRMVARHEAGHAVVAAALGLWHVATVNDDGGGLVSYDDSARAVNLAPEERLVLALAGNVAQALVIDGDMKRAVSDTHKLDSSDAVMLATALRELEDHTAVYRAAARARSILTQNRAEFDRLTAVLERDGVGKVNMPGVNRAARASRGAVDLTAGRVLGAAELRNLATRAQADGQAEFAKLLQASADRAAGQADKQIEFRGAT